MSDSDRFDGLYLNVAQQSRGIEPLLDSVFSFLRRKTDFFAGPPGKGIEAAIETVHAVVQKHADLYQKEQQNAKQNKKTKPKAATATAPQKKEDDVIEMGPDGAFDVSATPTTTSTTNNNNNNSTPTPAATTTTKTTSADGGGGDVSTPPPVGNGGTVPGKYVWTQLLSELIVTLPLPDHTRGADLDVRIHKQHLRVALRTTTTSQPTAMVDARLSKPIICDDSFWTVEDGNRLVINLQKLNQMEWWECVCEGDPKIDVKTIQPESSSLGT